MKKISILIPLILLALFAFTKTNSTSTESEKTNSKTEEENQKTTREEVIYTDGETTLKGYLFYPEDSKGKKSGVIVVHEWWGNNEYAQMRAEMIASLGYVAFAADMYGNGIVVDNPTDATKQSGMIYQNPNILKDRMQAAYDVLAENSRVDKKHIAAIGYCFGGTVALGAANMGVPVEVVVSFHGGLAGFKANEAMDNVQTLICHGAADQFVPETDVANFKKGMNAVNAPCEFKEYEGATHAFTNPEATEVGEKFKLPIAYNQAADEASWKDMKTFFDAHFKIK